MIATNQRVDQKTKTLIPITKSNAIFQQELIFTKIKSLFLTMTIISYLVIIFPPF
ncbi:hypothetical protein [Okeania sp.]|uniref:hypothetical protein n=1 Tax=Okeania sp. TaxID=3100323 RepID=UPI002B4B3806|nr:hypothetical protein [Okeania sp.]MEB3342011.1 hypothetical protein [Okeania sp.]